jgi:hypothetical protein
VISERRGLNDDSGGSCLDGYVRNERRISFNYWLARNINE